MASRINVSLLPSGKGFSKGVQNEAEKGFLGAEKSSNSFFGGVAKWAKRGAVLVGGMVTAVGALAVGGGIARALNIEDAQAKLKGLGNDTKTVEAIMNDALKSVKGTAFGLDAAATTAASAVAAGIKPGKELEGYLRLTADAATIAGTSMEEMGSIINQVTSRGYAGMENLNRLTERGIPIMQWLADEYGVTADALRDMVSRGEVDAATFRRAIENNIGGAALASGETTRGAFANMMAALSRLGLAFVGDGLSGAKTFFSEITIILDGLEERIGPWVEGIQDSLGGLEIEGFGENFLSGLDDFLNNFDSTPLGLLLTALEPLIPVFKEIGEKVGPVLAETFGEILDAIEPIIPLLSEALVDAVVKLAPPFTDLLIALLPLLPPLLSLVAEILPLLIPLLDAIIPGLTNFATESASMTDSISGVFDLLSGNTTLVEFGESIKSLEGPFFDIARTFADVSIGIAQGLGWLLGLWQSTWNTITSFFTGIGANLQATAQWIWQQVPAEFQMGVQRAVNWVQTLPSRIGAFFQGAGSWLVQSGKDLIDGFISGIKSMFAPVEDAVGGIMSLAAGFFPNSPAKRGPFSGDGWWRIERGGAALMEQFAMGAENFRPEFSFTAVRGALDGLAVTSGSSSSSAVNIYPTFEQQDPRIQMRMWGREAERAFSAS